MAIFVLYSLALLWLLRAIRCPYTECAVGSPSSVVNIASHQRQTSKMTRRATNVTLIPYSQSPHFPSHKMVTDSPTEQSTNRPHHHHTPTADMMALGI
ncbi:hypothetical protein V8F06_004696 [Rhypophila decipiens]